MRTIPSILKFIEKANETKQLRHPSYAAMQHAQHYFADIVILPLGDKFVERFLCEAVMDAKHACEAVLNRDEFNETIQNQRHSLAFDRLAQAARLHGMSQVPCKALSDRIQENLMTQENTSSLLEQLPRTCLNESQQEWLWNKSLFYQHKLVPADQDLQLSFEHAAKTSLCQVDVEQVLKGYPDLLAGKNETRIRRPLPP